MPTIPDRWRFRFDSEAASLRDLPWAEAMRVFGGSASGDFTAETEGECVSLEFNDVYAAVLYMGRDGVVLRPYFLHRPAADQDLQPFFCGGCGIRVGDRDEYLARFVSREDGFRLFVAVLANAALPTELPDPHWYQSLADKNQNETDDGDDLHSAYYSPAQPIVAMVISLNLAQRKDHLRIGVQV